MTEAEKIKKARAGLILDEPFFGTLALRLRPIADPSRPTMATNGEELRYNPQWVAGLSLPQVKGALAHEVLHVAAGHCWRRGKRDKARWQVAADFAINGILVDSGFELPARPLVDSAYRNMAAEEIYTDLPEPGPDGPKSENSGPENPPGSTNGPAGGSKVGQDGAEPTPDPGGCGAVEDSPAESPAAQKELEQSWRVATAQAAQAAKAMGKLPGGLARLVSEIVEPRVDWRTILRDFVQRAARNDYDWTRPSRRYLPRGLVLPSLISDELPAIAVAVDTSGSIGQGQLDTFSAEVSAILGEYDTTIRLLYVDSRVQGEATLTRADLPLRLEPKGGGGTDFRPAFDRLAEQGEAPAALIYLTDLYGRFPEQEPEYPTLWVCTTDREAPFGETVKLRIDR